MTTGKILVSACLLGERCRYDGASKPCDDPVFLQLKQQGRLIAVCPEMDGGLPVPRPPCQRCGNEILTEQGKNCTDGYLRGAQLAVEAAKRNNVLFCIMKEFSPSCGVNEIYDGSFTGRKISGEGLAVQLLRENGFRVFSENESEKYSRLL